MDDCSSVVIDLFASKRVYRGGGELNHRINLDMCDGEQVRVQVLEQQLNEARVAAARTWPARQDNSAELQRVREEIENALDMNQKLEEELSKRDELIEVYYSTSRLITYIFT